MDTEKLGALSLWVFSLGARGSGKATIFDAEK